MTEVHPQTTSDSWTSGLHDARDIIRLIQCPKCSRPLSKPITLPCGNSLCRQCLPSCHFRPNITYMANTDRTQGFWCPFTECGKEHAQVEASSDITVAKLMDMFEHMMQCSKSQEGRDVMEGPTTKAKLTGGTLFATYIMATEGRLPYNPVISYTDNHDEVGEFELRAADISFLETIKESMLVELDCQVCSNLLLHPLTTPCGHTFCRSCIMRAFDLAPPCPVCRRPFNLPSGANTSYTPVNKCLRAILQNLYPSKTAARKAVEADSTRNPDDLDTPIFVCTVAFPNMPTYLHIFESRYRLLIRRAMESGRQQAFGMVLFSPGLLEQHELGSVDFCQYGTMLRIVNQQLLPDGRSMIETRGEWRFKVIRHGMRDEYRIAKVERIDDISIAEEEELEAMEVGLPVRRGDDDAEMCFEPSDGRPLSQFHDSATLNSQYNPNELSRFRLRPPGPPDLRSLPTTALLQICGDFVARMRERIAPWLHENIIGLPHIFGK